MREALGYGAGSQHLRERRIALALEGKSFDQADREVGNAGRERPQLLPRKVHHAAIGGGNAGPLMDAVLEHFRTADEIAGMPISERDLARQRRGVEDPNPAALDEKYTVVLCALAEKRLTAIEDLAPALLENQLALGRRQLVHQGRWTADRLFVFGKKERRTGSRLAGRRFRGRVTAHHICCAQQCSCQISLRRRRRLWRKRQQNQSPARSRR